MTHTPLDAEADHLMNHARTDFASGRFGDAIAGCREALVCGSEPRTRVLALQTLVESLLHAGQPAEANAVLDDLRHAVGDDPQLRAATAEPDARLRFAERDYAHALAIAQSVPESVLDDEHSMADRDSLAEIEIKCLYLLDRPHEAALRLRQCLMAGHFPLTVPQTAEALEADGSGLTEVVTLFPAQALAALLFELAEAPAAQVVAVLEAVWQRYGATPVVLTFAAEVGARLPVINALDWSYRLRQAGQAERCTLLALARSQHRTARERALAAAVALEMFSDVNAMNLLVPALTEVPDAQSALVLDEMRILAPDIAVAIELVPTA
jgi:hypothetical protein